MLLFLCLGKKLVSMHCYFAKPVRLLHIKVTGLLKTQPPGQKMVGRSCFFFFLIFTTHLIGRFLKIKIISLTLKENLKQVHF